MKALLIAVAAYVTVSFIYIVFCFIWPEVFEHDNGTDWDDF